MSMLGPEPRLPIGMSAFFSSFGHLITQLLPCYRPLLFRAKWHRKKTGVPFPRNQDVGFTLSVTVKSKEKA